MANKKKNPRGGESTFEAAKGKRGRKKEVKDG